ncbi:glycosyltransferase family protein [Desulfobaculum sp.]
MRICIVNNTHLADAFSAMGHDVLGLRVQPGIQNIAALLAEHDFQPELFVEVEVLGARPVLTGLNEIACTKLFWSVDTHLNAWWHVDYGRLFDAVLTTQQHWVPRLEACGLPRVYWLPWFGVRRPYRPWQERSHTFGFIGRLSGYRPVRRRLVDYMTTHHGMAFYENIPYDQLHETYADVCVIPNESILAEVNFRLFEGISVGSLVLNQRGGTDIAGLFEPGKEVLEYGDVLELEEHVRYVKRHPEVAEAMAHAAWERVQREHLVEHRAQRIVEYAAQCGQNGVTGEDAAWHMASTLSMLWEAEYLRGNGERILQLAKGFEDEHMVARTLRLEWSLEKHEDLRELCAWLMDSGDYHQSFVVNFAGSMCALALGELGLAKGFWYRQVTDGGASFLKAESPCDVYMAWARECRKRGLLFRPGLRFVPGQSLPEAAVECCLAASACAPEDTRVMKQLVSLCGALEGAGEYHLGFASALSLREPDNWRLGVDLARVNFEVIRYESGVEELRLAHESAVKHQREEAFFKMLMRRDPSGRTLRLVREGVRASVGSDAP